MAFIALFVGGFDYVYGHVDEDPILPEFCPMCAAYQTLEIVFTPLVFLILLGILKISGTLLTEALVLPTSIYLNLNSPRAPPYSA